VHAVTEHESLDRAAVACQDVLADYQAGLVTDRELQAALNRTGVVVGETEIWLLDVDLGRWRHHTAVPKDVVFDGTTIRRWRTALQRFLSGSEPDTTEPYERERDR